MIHEMMVQVKGLAGAVLFLIGELSVYLIKSCPAYQGFTTWQGEKTCPLSCFTLPGQFQDPHLNSLLNFQRKISLARVTWVT